MADKKEGKKAKRGTTDPDVHTAPEGWFPTNLSRADKKEYVKYHKTHPKARNRWDDGSPRNPMPEIIMQNKYDDKNPDEVKAMYKKKKASGGSVKNYAYGGRVAAMSAEKS